ncbi:MAG: hypothetical protein ACTHL7_10440, partial [Steroidobacteraceae bacterium]
MNTASLNFRLVTWYAGVLTVVFVLLGAITFFSLRQYLEANVLDNQARRARQIADTLIARASRGSESALGAELESLYSPETNDRFIRITRADGTVVFASGAPHGGGFDPAQVPALAGIGARKIVLGDSSLLLAAVPAVASDGGRYRVEVGTSARPLEDTLRRL